MHTNQLGVGLAYSTALESATSVNTISAISDGTSQAAHSHSIVFLVTPRPQTNRTVKSVCSYNYWTLGSTFSVVPIAGITLVASLHTGSILAQGRSSHRYFHQFSVQSKVPVRNLSISTGREYRSQHYCCSASRL